MLGMSTRWGMILVSLILLVAWGPLQSHGERSMAQYLQHLNAGNATSCLPFLCTGIVVGDFLHTLFKQRLSAPVSSRHECVLVSDMHEL